MIATTALRALLDDHEQRYGRGDVWRAATEEMAELERDAARLDSIDHAGRWPHWMDRQSVRAAIDVARKEKS